MINTQFIISTFFMIYLKLLIKIVKKCYAIFIFFHGIKIIRLINKLLYSDYFSLIMILIIIFFVY